MAEVLSYQAAKLAAGKQVVNADFGRRRTLVIETPDTYSLASGDTLAAGLFIPAKARILGARVSTAGGGSTIDIGLRDKHTGEVLSSTAIASAVDVSSASTDSVEASNGDYLAGGVVRQLLEVDAEPFITSAGALSSALRVEIDYVGV
jgi:hypothetical protein